MSKNKSAHMLSIFVRGLITALATGIPSIRASPGVPTLGHPELPGATVAMRLMERWTQSGLRPASVWVLSPGPYSSPT